MQKYLSVRQLNPFRRALASLNTITRQQYQHYRDLSNIKSNYALLDHLRVGEYSDILSYTYRLFDCQKQRSIYQFVDYTDRDIGGESTAELYFDKEQQCLTVEGYIEAKDKDKMTQYPSIGFARTHPYKIRCGPFNAIQVQMNADGEPIHIGVQLVSEIQGVVSCYGIVTSRVKGWRCYQLPLQNMLLVGAQTGPRGSNNYQMPDNSATFYDRSAYDARRVLLTECSQPIIRDINFRLLGTSSTSRKVSVKSINLVRRSHSRKFLDEYREPFFFIVDKDPYVLNSEMGFSWLTKGYDDFKKIDLGDKVYKRMSQGASRR